MTRDRASLWRNNPTLWRITNRVDNDAGVYWPATSRLNEPCFRNSGLDFLHIQLYNDANKRQANYTSTKTADQLRNAREGHKSGLYFMSQPSHRRLYKQTVVFTTVILSHNDALTHSVCSHSLCISSSHWLAVLVYCTVCLKKNIPDIFSCNSRKHCRIFIMFGTHVTEKESNQKML